MFVVKNPHPIGNINQCIDEQYVHVLYVLYNI